MNILITGRPGIGKTTLIKELAEKLAGKAIGFYTEEIRKEGTRTGFRVKTLDGKTGILASVDIQSPYRVGKYKVDLEGFERVVLPVIESALKETKIIIIDEIGPMELYSTKFKELSLKAFDFSNPVVATIKQKSSPFTGALKTRSDVAIYVLEHNNREEVAEKILGSLG